ncbi:RDD family protein [Streptomyces sp. NPDC005438]|uniref:RDD family protein n=1 Tax=Streptomyces sp. NPDC005438 TaxID=3156880 RepID=UPI0033ABCE77
MSSPPSGSAGESPVPGYYQDPSIPGYIRYWNGTAWVPGTSRPEPREGEPLPDPPSGEPEPPLGADLGLPDTRSRADGDSPAARPDDQDPRPGTLEFLARTGRHDSPTDPDPAESRTPDPAGTGTPPDGGPALYEGTTGADTGPVTDPGPGHPPSAGIADGTSPEGARTDDGLPALRPRNDLASREEPPTIDWDDPSRLHGGRPDGGAAWGAGDHAGQSLDPGHGEGAGGAAQGAPWGTTGEDPRGGWQRPEEETGAGGPDHTLGMLPGTSRQEPDPRATGTMHLGPSRSAAPEPEPPQPLPGATDPGEGYGPAVDPTGTLQFRPSEARRNLYASSGQDSGTVQMGGVPPRSEAPGGGTMRMRALDPDGPFPAQGGPQPSQPPGQEGGQPPAGPGHLGVDPPRHDQTVGLRRSDLFPQNPDPGGYGYPRSATPAAPEAGTAPAASPGYGYPGQGPGVSPPGDGYGYPGQGGYGFPPQTPATPGGYGYPGQGAPQGGYGFPPQTSTGGYGYPRSGAGSPSEAGPVTPWRPPASDPFQDVAGQQARPAGLGRRLLARLIDTLVVLLVTAGAALPLVPKVRDHVDAKIDAVERAGETKEIWLLDGTTGGYLALVLGALLVFGVLYEALPTARWGRTLGKRICRLKVLHVERQEPLGFGAALLRWLLYGVLGVLVVGLFNVLWCVFDKPWRQCWHDKAAGSFVAGDSGELRLSS